MLYWSKCNLGIKMFAVSYDIGFMIDFLNPNSASTYSTHFKIKSSGIAVNCMLATLIAVTLAILNNLIPYVSVTAFSAMSEGAIKGSQDMSALVDVAVKYYSGTQASIVIQAAENKARHLREELNSLGGAISG